CRKRRLVRRHRSTHRTYRDGSLADTRQDSEFAMKRLMQLSLRAVTAFDWPLLAILALLTMLGLTLMHSAVGDTDWRFAEQMRNYLVAFLCMWVAALIPPPVMVRLAPWVYAIGVALLLGVAFMGETSKGATRWLNLGVIRLQPSEMMKIVVPLMLAWCFYKSPSGIRLLDFLVAAVLLLLPFGLIVLQPDLGTALLVFAAGFCVIYFAGLSFWLLIPVVFLIGGGLAVLSYYQDQICAPDVDWILLHDYQKYRVCILLDPSSDPLGKRSEEHTSELQSRFDLVCRLLLEENNTHDAPWLP